MFNSQRALHPQMRTISLEHVRSPEAGVLSVCEMSFWYGAGKWILSLCKNSNYHLAAKSFHQSSNMTLQLDTVQRVRHRGTLSLKWEIFIKPLFSLLRKLYGRGGGKTVEPRRMRDRHMHIWWKWQESKKMTQLHDACHDTFGFHLYLLHI